MSYAAYDHPRHQYSKELSPIVSCEIAVSIDKHIDYNISILHVYKRLNGNMDGAFARW